MCVGANGGLTSHHRERRGKCRPLRLSRTPGVPDLSRLGQRSPRMANRRDTDEVKDYTFESHQRPDGKIVKRTKNLAGIVVSEDLTSHGRVIESKSFDHQTGAFTGRAVYEWDEERKPLRTTEYDAEGDVVWIQERGQPPSVGEFYRGAKPFHIYPKRRGPNNSPEATPGRHPPVTPSPSSGAPRL